MSQLHGQLTQRDRDVLAAVARWRLANGEQIRRLFFGSRSADVRAAGRLLLRLTNHRLLTRLPRSVGGVRAGSSGFVYGLGPVGYRLLHEGASKTQRFEVSDGFLGHTLGLTELYVQLEEHARAGGFDLISADSEPSCWRRVDSLGGSDWLKPDMHVVLGAEETELHSFVEMDNGTEHRAALLRKLAQYEVAYRAGHEQAKHGVFPRVVWLVPDAERAAMIRAVIRTGPGVTADLHAVVEQVDAVAALSGQVNATK